MKEQQIDFLGDLFDAAGLTKAKSANKAPAPAPASVADIAELDRIRNERDRVRHHGYDNNSSSPNHQEYLLRAELSKVRAELALERQRAAEVDRAARQDGWIPEATAAQTLAHSLIGLCVQFGLRLNATPEGLFIELSGGEWREIATAIEEMKYCHATRNN